MNPADQREEAVFEAALQLRAGERPTYLDQACAGDADLRRRVEVLLSAFERAGVFMNEPASPARTLLVPVPTEKPGDRIGRYKLLEQIGEGGCGVVYVAEQEEPVRRRVALKVIKLGMDTKQVIARFDAERQALAMMDHPNIAKIFDAGITEAAVIEGRARHSVRAEAQLPEGGAQRTDAPYLSPGRPYFVMELVRGIKITDYCDQNHLSPRERLDLFIQVCRAIQHAHQKGVIHRDIKPSNILVTRHDGVPVPKVIDFGIAKATQGRLTDQTVYTAFEQFIGTPAYMSPEQAELSGLDIDTRSDIYSLGVLLYELLTGTTPFDAKELLAKGLDEMRRTIREVEPVKPSTRLTQELNTQKVGRVAPRAPSSAEPATESGAHGVTRPTNKSAIRNLQSAIPSDLDWIVMKCLEKDRTRRYETANGLATDVARHLNNEPIVARPPSRLYRFQKSVQRNKLAFGAATAVALALAFGLAISTAMFFRAEAEKKRAETEATKSKQVAQVLEDMLTSADDLAIGRDTALFGEMLDQTADRIRRDFTNQPDVEIQLLRTIGHVYSRIGDPKKAEAQARRGLALRRQATTQDDAIVADSLSIIGVALWRQGKSAEAEGPAREALAMRRRLFGNKSLKVATALETLGAIVKKDNRLIEAEDLFRESLRIEKNKLSSQDVRVALTADSLLGALIAQGKLNEAENVAREALAIFRTPPNDTYFQINWTLSKLGNLLYEQGRLAEAEPCFREALALRRKDLGNEHDFTAAAMSGLASTLRGQGKLAEAEALYRECLTAREKKVPDAWYTFHTRTLLGATLVGEKKYAEAEPLLLSGYQGMKQREANIRDHHKVFSETLQHLIQLYEDTNRAERAVDWKQKLEALNRMQEESGALLQSLTNTPAEKKSEPR